MKKILLALLSAALLSPAWANPAMMAADEANARGDYAAKLRITRRLVEKGESWAQFNLGNMYDTGQGVAQDYTEAVKWYRLAAAQGHARAQSNLGAMYGNGEGVPQDAVKAHMWMNLAAAKGNANGSRNRDIVAKRITPQQIAEAQKMARDCLGRNLKGCD
jgi:TPR repeat protein